MTKEVLDISPGYFAVPNSPGLSVTFDDEKLARYRIDLLTVLFVLNKICAITFDQNFGKEDP